MLPIIKRFEFNNPLYKLFLGLSGINILLLFLIITAAVSIVFFIIFIIQKKYKLEAKDFNKEITKSAMTVGIISIVIFLIVYLLSTKLNLKKIILPFEHYEGLYFLLGILSAITFFTYIAKKDGIDLEVMFEGIFIGLITALITGKLFSYLFWDTKAFLSDPLMIIKNCSGISVTGGVLGGLVAGFIFLKVKKLSFFYHMRYFAVAIPLGHIVGRFGCFLNGDAGGSPTNLPWGVVFYKYSVAYAPYTSIPRGTHVHPTQIYEIIGNLIIVLFMILTTNNEWITRRRIVWYALGYSTVRFIVEFFRADRITWRWIPFLSTGQIICLMGFAIGIGTLIWSLLNDDKLDPGEEYIARVKTGK